VCLRYEWRDVTNKRYDPSLRYTDTTYYFPPRSVASFLNGSSVITDLYTASYHAIAVIVGYCNFQIRVRN